LTPVEETARVVRSQCGDRDALERLLRDVQRPLHGYVTRLIGSTDADDVTQDVLVTIARKLAWLTEPRVFRPWAFRIASRAAFNHLRRQKRRAEEPLDDERAAAIEAAPARPAAQAVSDLLASDALSPASRAVLALHFEQEMPLAEVAAVLEIPLGTVKSRLSFGLKALRRQLREPGPDRVQ